MEAQLLTQSDRELRRRQPVHAFASIMIERGITAVVLADLMGHGDSGVAERTYIHLFNRKRTDEAVRMAMQSAMDL
jgi:integrase